MSSSGSGPVPEPPSAQSPFARSRRYRPRQGVMHLVGGRYPSFLAHMGSCDRPNSSTRLRLPLVRAIFAGCCQPLLGDGPSRRYLRSLCQVAWTRTPPRLCRSRSVCVSLLFGGDTGSSPELRPRPSLYGLGTRNVPCMATSTGCGISGLQSFAIFRLPHSLGLQVAPTAVIHRAARPFTSRNEHVVTRLDGSRSNMNCDIATYLKRTN